MLGLVIRGYSPKRGLVRGRGKGKGIDKGKGKKFINIKSLSKELQLK